MKRLFLLSFLVVFASIFLSSQKIYGMDRAFYKQYDVIDILDKDCSDTVTDAMIINDRQIAASLTNGHLVIANISPLCIQASIPMSGTSSLIAIDSIQNGRTLAIIDENAHLVIINRLQDTMQKYSFEQIFSKERSYFAQGNGSICLLENGNIVAKRAFDTMQKCFASHGTLLSFIDTKKEVVKHKIAPVYSIDKMIPLSGNRCLALINQQALQIFDFTKKEIEAPIIFEFSKPVADFTFLADHSSNQIAIIAISEDGLLTCFELPLNQRLEKTTIKFYGEKEVNIKKVNKIIPLDNGNILFVQNNKKLTIYNAKSNKIIQKMKEPLGEIISVLPLNDGNFIVVYRHGRIVFFEKTTNRVTLTIKRTNSINPLICGDSLSSSDARLFNPTLKSYDQRETEKAMLKRKKEKMEKKEDSEKDIEIEAIPYRGRIREWKKSETSENRVNVTIKEINSMDLFNDDEIQNKESLNVHLKGTTFFSRLTPLINESKESEKGDEKEEIAIPFKRKINFIRVKQDDRKREKMEKEEKDPEKDFAV